MLFNFTLTPLTDVRPWGKPESLFLSWFGLTDGEYWIQAGESTLFEYSAHARKKGASRYCDYQVIRLYEDLIDMLPSVLEPVPSSLVQYMGGDTAAVWNKKYHSWCDLNQALPDADHYWKIVDAAQTWICARYLDSAYLCPTTTIIIWSDMENVHFEWNNREKDFEGELAWTALQGHYQLPRLEFLDEVRSFHDCLMEQMSERVKQVLSGALSPEIYVDIPGLVREHEQRCRPFDMTLSLSKSTDWQETERAINEILAAS